MEDAHDGHAVGARFVNDQVIVEALDPSLADVRLGGVLQRQRRSHLGLLRQVVEIGFGVGKEAVGQLQSSHFREMVGVKYLGRGGVGGGS